MEEGRQNDRSTKGAGGGGGGRNVLCGYYMDNVHGNEFPVNFTAILGVSWLRSDCLLLLYQHRWWIVGTKGAQVYIYLPWIMYKFYMAHGR